MSHSANLENKILGIGRPVSISGIPVLSQQVALSAAPRGRGSYVPSRGYIYYANYSNGTTLLRFNTVTNQQDSSLQVTGGPVGLRGCAYNAVNGFMYCLDNPGGTDRMLKINLDTGAATVVAGAGPVSSDIFYDSVLGNIWATGAGTVQRVSSADAVTTIGTVWSGAPRGLDRAAINATILSAGLNAVARINSALAVASVATGLRDTYPMSYGTASKKALVGYESGVADPDSIQVFDPVALTLSPLSISTAGRFLSGGYSTKFGMHFIVDGMSGPGTLWVLSDAPLGNLVKTFLLGNVQSSLNDSFPVDTGAAVYVPAGGVPRVNIFR